MFYAATMNALHVHLTRIWKAKIILSVPQLESRDVVRVAVS